MTDETTSGRADRSSIAKEQAFEWFVAGFAVSGEGYNGEYPFAFEEDRIKRALEGQFEEVWPDDE